MRKCIKIKGVAFINTMITGSKSGKPYPEEKVGVITIRIEDTSLFDMGGFYDVSLVIKESKEQENNNVNFVIKNVQGAK